VLRGDFECHEFRLQNSKRGPFGFGGNPESAKLCLRELGDELDPDEVSRLMGRAPSRSRRKGQPVLDDSGRVRRLARTGSWLLDFPLSSETTIAEGIKALVGSLPDEKKVWATLNEHFHLDLLCDIFVRGVIQGFVLSAKVLEMLTRRGIKFGVDISTVTVFSKPL
jgi:hypothetical protein